MSQPSSVLVVHPGAELYGADRMVLEAVRGLCAAGWRTVVVLPGKGPLAPLLRSAGADVRVIRTPVLRKAYLSPCGVLRYAALVLAAVPRVLRVLSDVRPDVVYVSTVTVPLWLAAARVRRTAVACHVHEAEQSVPRVVRWSLAAPLLLCGAVLANSRVSRDVLLAEHPRLAGRTTVLYNGFEGPPAPRDAREELSGPVRLLLLGRISARKGSDVAVAALARLVQDRRDVTLDLVGDVFPGYEGFEQELRAQVVQAGLADRVHFRGVTADPWQALAAADIVLVPSRVEPFGNTAVEAMLARRPVVASRAQGLTEIVDPAVDGELVPPGDPQALAAAVALLVDDWPRARARAAAAAERAADRFSPTRYRDGVVAALQALTPGR